MNEDRIIEDRIIENATRKELVEMLELTEKWASYRDSKFYLYEPNLIPRYFHASTAKTRAIFGTNRSSKSYSHIIDFAAQFSGEAPNALKDIIPKHRLDQTRRLRFCMEDYPNSFSKVIYPYIQALVPDEKIVDVVKDSGRVRAITNAKGGFIEFMYYDQETMKHAGASRHAIGYDEQPPEDIREQGLMRLIDTDGEETFSLTPEAGAIHYLYDDIYLKRGLEVERTYELVMDTEDKLEDVKAGEVVQRTIPGGDPNIHVFFASLFDNTAIKKEAAIRILRKFEKNELQLKALGKFIFLGGLVYKDYSDAIHLIEPFDDWWKKETSQYYTLFIAIDPHPRAPHAVLFMVARRDGMLFIVDEIFSPCTAPELVQQIKDKCHGKVPEMILIDPLASTPDPSTKSCFLTDIYNYGLRNPVPHSASKDKENGIIACQKRLKVIKRSPEDKGTPGIFITSNCQRFRYEITRYSWDDWKKASERAKGEKQKPVDKDDHMMENWYRLENIFGVYLEDYDKYDEEDSFSTLAPTTMTLRGRNAVTGY